MARTGIRGVAFAAAGLLLFSFATSTDADDIKVGVTAAVNPDTVGQPPAAEARTMLIGADVMFKERIATTDTGQAQLLFLDQSSLTVAPKSEVVIDEFVYDPKQNVGKLAANVTKGLMRYVGGAISKESEVQFTTPSATVGIRGGMVLILVNQLGGTVAAFLYGRHMNVTANGVTETVTRPGFTIAVGQPGQPPSPPTPTQSEFIQDALLALEGHPGSTGGAPEPPTDLGFAQTGLGQQLEHIDPLAIQTTLSGGRGGPQQVIVAQLPDTTGIIANAAQNQQRDTIATSVTTTASSPSMTPPPPPPPPSPTTLNGYAGGIGVSFRVDGSTGSPVILENPNQGNPNQVNQVTIQTSVLPNGVTAQFNLQVDTTGGSDVKSATVNFGGAGGSSAFVNDSTFAATQMGATTGTLDGLPVGANSTSVLVTSNLAIQAGVLPSPSSLPEGVSYCQCQFLQWGIWAASLANTQRAEQDVGLGTWVAGVLPSIAAVKMMTGTAIYDGHIIGTVSANNGTPFFAVGGFHDVWNFGTRSGMIAINQFDGRSYTGSASATMANPRDFTGSFASTATAATAAGAFTGTLNGSFFQGGGSPVAAQGGQFSIRNAVAPSASIPIYKASGIVAAAKQ